MLPCLRPWAAFKKEEEDKVSLLETALREKEKLLAGESLLH